LTTASACTEVKLVTGGEVVGAGKALSATGRHVLGEDEKTKDVLLRLAEDTPEMKAAARSKAARVAVKERVKLKLYQPFARMLGVSEAYFEDRFPEEMGVKTADIPDENLVTPPASIAVPALFGLSYSFEESTLKDLYLNLLTTASDNRRNDIVHPGFAEVIKQLTSSEAKLLNVLLSNGNGTTAARLKNVRTDPSRSYSTLLEHLLPVIDDASEWIEESRVPTWVDNWSRLGLVYATYSERRARPGAYDWVMTRPEYLRFKESPGVEDLQYDAGLVEPTNFGRDFFRAVTPTITALESAEEPLQP
jgi:hypothetical protein